MWDVFALFIVLLVGGLFVVGWMLCKVLPSSRRASP
jgi:hypothetical protein